MGCFYFSSRYFLHPVDPYKHKPLNQIHLFPDPSLALELLLYPPIPPDPFSYIPSRYTKCMLLYYAP